MLLNRKDIDMSNILNKILLSILYAIFLFPFVIRLYYISHGLDFSDECWSLILWRDKPNNMIDNQYYLLFGNMLGDNPIVLRLANLFLQVFGQIIFVLGLYIFYQKHYPNNGTKIYLYIA